MFETKTSNKLNAIPSHPAEDLIPQNNIFVGVKPQNKKKILNFISEKASKIIKKTNLACKIYESLLLRESLGSTGLGQGVAISHAKLSEIEQVHVFFIRLENSIDFNSIDNQPVDLLFAVISPEHANSDHLRSLAKIARFIRIDSNLNLLRSAKDESAIYVILSTI